jgi:hypothetical protein
VRDDDGAPAGGVKVTLLPAAPADMTHPPAGRTQPVRLEATTDDLGHFEVLAVAPGRYTMRFAHDELMRKAGDVVSVSAGETVRGLEVRLAPVSIVEGLVTRQGQPAAYANLNFRSRDLARGQFDETWARSDRDGRFRARLIQSTDLEVLVPDAAHEGGPWVPALAPRSLVVDRPRIDGVSIELPLLSPAADLTSFVTPAGARPLPPAHAREADFGDHVRILGYDLASDHVKRGDQLEVTVHFAVLSPLPGWRLFSHVTGPTGLYNMDHVPVGGIHPVDQWAAGETIRDRFTIRIDARFPAGPYTLFTGFWRQSHGADQRLPVIPASQQDGANRMRVLTFTVE